MKLKYYMRGVGTGILFTLFVFVIIIIPNFQFEKESDTDNGNTVTEAANDSIADILGTGEENDLSGIPELTDEPELTASPEPTEESVLTKIPENTPTTDPTPTAEPTPTTEPAPTAEPTPTNEPTPTAEPTPTSAPSPTPVVEAEGETARLVIEKGMTSEQVSLLAEKLGIVSSWEDFNKYLINNGYADYIMIGSYTIEKGASYRTIVGIITNR